MNIERQVKRDKTLINSKKWKIRITDDSWKGDKFVCVQIVQLCATVVQVVETRR